MLEKPPRSPWRMLLDQFADFMILVLIGATAVPGVTGEVKGTLAMVVPLPGSNRLHE